MFRAFVEKVRSLGRRQVLLWGLALAAVIEVVTAFTRFGLGMSATRDTTWLAPLTGGLRIHHAYYGLVLVAVSLLVKGRFWKNALLIVGVGCFVSDMVHHFLVLWPITGSPQFDLMYPDYWGK